MQALLALLAKPLIDAALSAFGRVIMDMIKAWQVEHAAREAGRASAVIAAHEQALAAERRMSEVQVLTEDELLRRLREGDA